MCLRLVTLKSSSELVKALESLIDILRFRFWHSKVVLLTLVFLFLFKAQAQESVFVKGFETLGLSGSARAGYWESDKSLSTEDDQAVGGFWLQARPAEFYGVKTYFDWRLQGQNLSRNDDGDDDLREAYIERSFGNFDLKIGRQITVWGRADKANPTDNWSIRDLSLLVLDDEDQRGGLIANQLIYNISSHRFIFIWQPEWRSPSFPDFSLPTGVTLAEGEPRHSEEQYGIKFDTSSSDWDWSLSYSRVNDKNPDLKLLSAGPGGTQLEFSHLPIDVFGGDFAKTFGPYGFRGEIAYTQTSDGGGDEALTKNSFLYSVLGVERTFFGDFNVNVQYLYRDIYDWQNPQEISDLNSRFLAQVLQVVSLQNKSELHGYSLRLNYKMWNETLDLELATVSWDSSYLWRPKIKYIFSDELQAWLGGEFYNGRDDSFFGRLENYSSVATEIRYLF